MMERSGERATGTPNTIYDLSSVLFHALEAGASYDQYIQDSEEAGDDELADFFRRVRDEDAMRADEAQILLAERTPAAGAAGGDVMPEGGIAAGAAPGMEPMEDVPPPREEPIGVAPGTEPIEDVPPREGPTDVAPGTEPIEDVPPLREEPVSVAPDTEPIVEEPSRQRTEPGTVAPGMEEEVPLRTEEPPLRTEEAPPPRASRMGESDLPRTEDVPPPMEDRPLGTEGAMPPVTEEVPPRAEGISPGTEESSPREAPFLEEVDRARQAERDREVDQGEDRGLVEKVKDALSGEEERGRGEGADEPRRR